VSWMDTSRITPVARLHEGPKDLHHFRGRQPNGATMHRVNSSVTFHIDTFQKSANSLVGLVRDRSSEDLVSNFPDAIQSLK
jgi:hypothetical protein